MTPTHIRLYLKTISAIAEETKLLVDNAVETYWLDDEELVRLQKSLDTVRGALIDQLSLCGNAIEEERFRIKAKRKADFEDTSC